MTRQTFFEKLKDDLKYFHMDIKIPEHFNRSGVLVYEKEHKELKFYRITFRSKKELLSLKNKFIENLIPKKINRMFLPNTFSPQHNEYKHWGCLHIFYKENP